jgi:hypothetical protein
VTENVGIVFAPAGSGAQGYGTPQNSNASLAAQTTPSSAASIIADYMTELSPPQSDAPLAVIGTSQSPELPGGMTGGGGAGSGHGAASGDGLLSATFMGAKGTGRKFVYVLDRSASTGFGQRRSPLYVAKNELLASLQSLGDLSLRESKPIQFQVIFFNHEAAVFNTVGFGGSDRSGRLLRYDQATFAQVQRFLGGIIADGGTKPEPALLQAVRMDADCIFFMTDGATQLNPLQLQRIRATSKGAVQINVVEYGSGTRRMRNDSLQQLAAEHHGNLVYVDLSKLSR